MLSYLIPTHNRPQRLKATILALESLGDHRDVGGAEVIVIDNASSERLILPPRLSSGVPLRAIYLPRNEGAAARNHGARASDPASTWLVMLDDDSYPDDTGYLRLLARQPADVGAVSADIWLPTRRGEPAQRESGGLPEVFIGCGVAVRRELFLKLGGYDPSFNYYVEEYDLAARLLLAGSRVVFSPGFSVTHAKDARGRDMNRILARLVRNNGYVAQRYAPADCRAAELRETRRRYRRVAEKEHALRGYTHGLRELRRTIRAQARTPMPRPLWDRFTGLAAARQALQSAHATRPFSSATIIDSGKNAWAVSLALTELGVRIVGENDDAEAAVIGTMSPGPMLDAYERRVSNRRYGGPRVLMPWTIPSCTPEQARMAA
jgi:GT2 family glycosyltransferase